jgi:hypothetical protein
VTGINPLKNITIKSDGKFSDRLTVCFSVKLKETIRFITCQTSREKIFNMPISHSVVTVGSLVWFEFSFESSNLKGWRVLIRFFKDNLCALGWVKFSFLHDTRFFWLF